MKKLLLLLLLIPSFVFCQIPDPLPNTYVNDFASVLKPDELKTLNETILSIEKKSSVQIAVVLINDLPGDMQIEDYARELGRKWHVGNAKNGLVYVAAINQHKQRLEVSSELEGYIPDAEAQSITDKLKPNFRNKDYYGGLQVLLGGLNERIDPAIKEQNRLAAVEQAKKEKQAGDVLITVFIWLGLIGAACVSIWYFVVYPIQKRKNKEREEKEAQERSEREKNRIRTMDSFTETYRSRAARSAALGVTLPLAGLTAYELSKKKDEDTPYVPPTYNSSNDDYSSRSSSSSSSSDDSSSFGNWGSGSSDSSSSSDSGFSGGGSSNDW